MEIQKTERRILSDLSETESATIWHLNIGPSSGPAGAAFSQVSFLGLFQINKD